MKKDKNYYDLGWVSKIGGDKLHYGVQWSKKERLWGIAVIGAFTLLGVSVNLACKDAFFKGAQAASDAEYGALKQLGLLERA